MMQPEFERVREALAALLDVSEEKAEQKIGRTLGAKWCGRCWEWIPRGRWVASGLAYRCPCGALLRKAPHKGRKLRSNDKDSQPITEVSR